MLVGIIDSSRIDNDDIYNIAYETGDLIGKSKWHLICSELGGVMEYEAA